MLNNRYLIGDAIGEGGFGITYIGIDVNLDLRIAVKEFYPHGYANRNNSVTNNVTLIYSKETEYFNDSRDRFLREAQSIAKFSKEKAIVDVRDYFTENNTAYIVMEYIDGITLSAYLKRSGVFDASDIIGRMIPLMEALEKMHHMDVIHRDISPDNIMMTTEGSLKLMDFGSARYFAGDNKRTMSVIFKPGYAPFEQYSTDGNQGPWTDVYALCATIYKCITNITPPDAMSRCQQDTLKKPSSLGVALSPVHESILMRGMSIYPADRWQSISEMLTALKMNASMYADYESTMLADDKPSDGTRLTYGDTYSYASKTQAEPYKKKSHTGVIVAIILVVTFLIIGGVTAFFLLRNTNDKDQATVQTTEINKVTVPNVAGKKYSDAKAELEELGLVVETTYELSDSIAKDYVTRQSVEADRQLNPGDTIMLYVSDGAPTEAPEVTEAETTAPQTSSSQSSQEAERKPEPTRPDPPSSKTSSQLSFHSVPYLVRIFPDVYVYESAESGSSVVMTLDEENVYTIVEETKNNGILWGRLKSGAGWLNLNEVFANDGYITGN